MSLITKLRDSGFNEEQINEIIRLFSEHLSLSELQIESGDITITSKGDIHRNTSIKIGNDIIDHVISCTIILDPNLSPFPKIFLEIM